jgi:hypothetical protein
LKNILKVYLPLKNINGQPVSRLNDQTKHGGVIQAASPNVVVGETASDIPDLPPPSALNSGPIEIHESLLDEAEEDLEAFNDQILIPLGPEVSGPEELAAEGAEKVETVAPEVIAEGKKIAADFYQTQGYTDSQIEKHLKGIDFNYPVTIKKLSPGTILEQKQIPGMPQGSYYSQIGTPATKIGINPQGEGLDGKIYDKIPKKYMTTDYVDVLQSTAAKIKDDWSISSSPYQTEGGGIQYFSPNKSLFKELS